MTKTEPERLKNK